MLNFDALNRQLLVTAQDSESFENFEKALNLWEEFHGANDNGAFYNLLSFANQVGIWTSLVPNPAPPYGIHKDIRNDRIKKVKLILDHMQKRDMTYIEALNHLPLNQPDGKFYQRLMNNGMTELLEHPLVKDEIAIDMIRQYLLAGKTDKAIQKFKETKIDATRVFHPEFFGGLIAAIPQAPKLDKMLSDLAKQDLLPLSVISSLAPAPFNVAALVNYPKLTQTDLVAMMTAIATLSKEEYADGIPSLVALRHIDQDLNGNNTLATELLSFLQNQWGAAPVLSAADAADIEKIILALLDNGAEIMPTLMMPAGMYQLFQLMTSNGMVKALAHPSAIEKFKAMITACQHPILSSAGKYNLLGVAPSQTDLEMMKILCPHAKNDMGVAGINIFDVQGMINVLNTWQTIPHDAASHDRLLKIQGLLLKHGLVDGIETVQPGSYSLTFNDPKTAMPYDLYAYMMDNPALQHGFRKPQRDEELLSLYGLTKAILAQETRTPTELQKVKHYAGFRETTEAGVPVVYNRYDLKEQMQNTQKNVRAAIMKFVDPARDIPADRRQVTAQNLERIALEHLPAVEQVQNSNLDATAQTSKERRKLQ